MADLNGYTSLYESRAGNTQTYGVGVTLSCNLDVAGLTTAACDVNITTSDTQAQINTKLNGAGTVFCVAKGDYSSKGAITITASGTSGTRKIMRYYDASDDDAQPWNQSSANQATFKRIDVTGDYWIVHRLRIARGDGTGRSFITGDHNILNRCLVENSAIRLLTIQGLDNCVQSSVIRKAGDDFTAGSDEHGLDFSGGDITNTRVVNNEIYDCTGDCIQNNASTNCSGLITENNDLYVTSAYQTLAAAGKSCSEQGMDLKHPLATSGNPAIVLHNRIWGFKRTDTTCGGSGSNGEGIILNGDPGDSADYCLIKNNIFIDLPGAIGVNAGEGGFNSIIGNLIYDIYDDSGDVTAQAIKLQDANNTEVYLNTIISASPNWIRFDDNGTCDYRGNVIIGCGAHNGVLGSGSQIDRNCYYDVSGTKLDTTNIDKSVSTRANSTNYTSGDIVYPNTLNNYLYKATTTGQTASSPPSWPTVLGATVSDGTVTWQAIRGPYTFYRKLLTSPEQYTIPYARVHTSAPEHQLLTSGFAARDSIGVDDSEP